MKQLSFLFAFCIYVCLSLVACVSKPVLQNTEPLPPVVREYKTVKIYGHIPGMQNTGVYLNEGDVYSLFAAGEINVWPGNPEKWRGLRKPGQRTMGRIGKDNVFALISTHFSGDLIQAYSSGKLYIGISDGAYDKFGNALNRYYFKDNVGAFTVDIIVWQRKDWAQIADFYESLFKQNPENPKVRSASGWSKAFKELDLAEKETSEELVKVEQEIQELKQKSEPPPKATPQATPEKKKLPPDKPQRLTASEKQRIVDLEKKLARLTATMAQLEEMKLKFEAERNRGDLLAKELEKQKNKEKELLTKLEKSSKSPPVIVVATPRDGTNTEAPFIGLSGVVVDEQGLEQLQFHINDRTLDERDQRGTKLAELQHPKRFEFKEKIPLDKGANTIRISAVDSDGTVTERLLTVHKTEKRRKIWAVVIGVDTYPKIRQLKYAVNDAKAFYRHLVKFTRIPPENILLLLNEEAGLIRLRSTLGTYLKNKAGKNDMVIIYFAGHGAAEKDVTSPDGDGLEKYLLPFDVNPRDLYATALPMGEISRVFTRIQSERLIFIADACYSGASGGRTVSFTGIRASISEGFLDRIASGKGKIILTASGANEVSEENETLGHGVFTFYLLEGLRGNADTDKDGLITVDEIYRYVSFRVPEATNNEQHPVKKGSVEGQLVLGFVE